MTEMALALAGRKSRTRMIRSRFLRPVLGILPKMAPPTVTLILLLLAWQLLATLTSLPKGTLPSPGEVAGELVRSAPLLLQHGLHTGGEAVLGFLLAAAIGLSLGLAMTLSTWVREALYPNLVALQVVPKIALAPMFLVWFGIGFESRLILSAFISFFPIVIATTSGLVETDPGALKLCRSLRASRFQTLIGVRLPYALPFIFSGLKVASTMALIGVVVGEFISSRIGLGHLIMNASSRIDTAQVLASIVALCVLGLGMFALTHLAQLWCRKRWWPQ